MKSLRVLAVAILSVIVLTCGLFAQQNSVGTAGGSPYSVQYNSNTGFNGAAPGAAGQTLQSTGPNTPPAFANSAPVVYAIASGAIALTSGEVSLGSTSALAMTLASPATPANDGVHIYIVAATAHAHTVTGATNAIIGSKHLITFAAQGDAVELEAVGGVWYVRALYGTAVIS